MKRSLIIAYDYPPRGWSGVQRTVKFVRYLPEFGWEPLALAPNKWFLPAPEAPEMLDEVRHAPAVRTGMLTHEDVMRIWTGVGRALWPLLKICGKDASWFADGVRWRYARWLCPDYACGWIPSAVRAGLKFIRTHRPSVIYATAPPYSSLVIGLILSKCTRLPLVADFRDLWTDYPNPMPVARYRAAVDPWLERRVVRNAARIINVTDSNSELLAAKYPRIPRRRFVTIFNGFDPEDLPASPPPVPDARRLGIAHVGSLYGNRTPHYVLDALQSLVGEEPGARQDIRLKFVGDVGEHAEGLCTSPCADMLELPGPVNHMQATRQMAEAQVLLLIVGEGGEGVLTGKLFEYMASRRHILATVPIGGEAARILRAAGGATVVDVQDVPGIKKALGDLYKDWLNGGIHAPRNEPFVGRFQRRELTRQLAEVFDECVGAG